MPLRTDARRGDQTSQTIRNDGDGNVMSILVGKDRSYRKCRRRMTGGKCISTFPESSAAVAIYRTLAIGELLQSKDHHLRMSKRLEA